MTTDDRPDSLELFATLPLAWVTVERETSILARFIVDPGFDLSTAFSPIVTHVATTAIHPKKTNQIERELIRIVVRQAVILNYAETLIDSQDSPLP